MPEQPSESSEKSGIDGKIGRLTAIIGAMTALIGAVFVLISTFGEGYNKVFHASNPPAGSAPAGPHATETAHGDTGRPAGTCMTGFVWRDAVAGDHICVTPDARRRAALDNAASLSHVSTKDHGYGAATCAQGYVWREATQADHTCVTVEIRDQTRADNQAAASRIAP